VMANELDHFDDGKPTVGERIWYFLNGLVVVAPQIYLYHSVFGVDARETYYLYVAVSLVAAFIMSQAYHNVSFWLRDRLTHAREDVVTANLVASANAGKKNAKQIQDVKERQKKHTSSESSAFSIVYNNFFFLFAFFVIGFYFFPNFPAPFGYAFSVISSASSNATNVGLP